MNTEQTSLLAAFLAARVDCVVVGGVAVNAHGYVPATNDLDLFIRPTEGNARPAFRALQALGVPLDGYQAADLLDDEENLRFGPQDDHIDILASIGETRSGATGSNERSPASSSPSSPRPTLSRKSARQDASETSPMWRSFRSSRKSTLLAPDTK